MNWKDYLESDKDLFAIYAPYPLDEAKDFSDLCQYVGFNRIEWPIDIRICEQLSEYLPEGIIQPMMFGKWNDIEWEDIYNFFRHKWNTSGFESTESTTDSGQDDKKVFKTSLELTRAFNSIYKTVRNNAKAILSPFEYNSYFNKKCTPKGWVYEIPTVIFDKVYNKLHPGQQ